MIERSNESPSLPVQTMEQRIFEFHGKGIGEPSIAKELNITRCLVRKILKGPVSTATDRTTPVSTVQQAVPTGSAGRVADVETKKIKRTDAGEALDVIRKNGFPDANSYSIVILTLIHETVRYCCLLRWDSVESR